MKAFNVTIKYRENNVGEIKEAKYFIYEPSRKVLYPADVLKQITEIVDIRYAFVQAVLISVYDYEDILISEKFKNYV